MYKEILFISAAAVASFGCGHDDEASGGNEEEVLTTVTLTFTPENGGTPIVAVFNDPDGDGGDDPTVDAIELAEGTYTTQVGFENRLEDPPEIITAEVADESDVHQVFFTGDAVNGPATDNPNAPLGHSYADEDANGLPVGLENTVVASAGTGELTITLRHMPPVGDAQIKTADVAAEVKAGGFSAIGGTSDAQVTFAVTVQ
tara:strand:- start:30439 stop:31044 length:606 start_codon:yes stop_codon:yes gene_type:complete